MAHGITVPDRAQRLRELAASAENLATLALAADERLATARADLLVIAKHARNVADQLNRAADGEAVEL